MSDKMEQEVEAALRSGDPESAARAIMTHKNISLDAARKEVHERLTNRKR